MIHIPSSSLNKTLKLKIYCVYDNQFTRNIKINMGDSQTLALKLICDDGLDMVLNILLMILGIAVFITVCIGTHNKVYTNENLYFAILSMCIVLWTNNDLYINQLLIRSSISRYYMYYLMFYITPVVLMFYLNELIHFKLFKPLCVVYSLFISALIILQIFGVAEFTETIALFLIVGTLTLITALFSMSREKERGKLNGVVIFSLGFMIVTIIANGLIWFLNRTDHTRTTLAKIGLSVYMTISIIVSIDRIIKNLLELNKTHELQKLAYTDGLTGLKNRYAFERDVKTKDLKTLAIISLDINNLKFFNDSFGHACGDKLIKESANMLRDIFDDVYRTGGDEFIALSSDKTITQLEDLRIDLLNRTSKYNNDESHDIIIEIACGYAVSTSKDETFESILKRSDKEMYRNKKKLKKHSKVKYTRGEIK
jgi:diguanylate cyclase (GGDEF)-like protein